jgi:RNA polymerase II elongation factor ELL
LYHCCSEAGDDEFTFTGLINHGLAVQKAEEVTSGVDTALEQLKSSMAAISEMKEANKYVLFTACMQCGRSWVKGRCSQT